MAGFKELNASLSGRERQVLDLISQGLTNKEIASQLFIQPSTVKRHTENILNKLRVRNRVQAAVYLLSCRNGVPAPSRIQLERRDVVRKP
jgi:DNA-binding NarL/FixJ family response regulator